MGVKSLGEAILKAIGARRGDEAATRNVAEELNKALPESLSGRSAVLRKRKQYSDIERMLEGSR